MGKSTLINKNKIENFLIKNTGNISKAMEVCRSQMDLSVYSKGKIPESIKREGREIQKIFGFSTKICRGKKLGCRLHKPKKM